MFAATESELFNYDEIVDAERLWKQEDRANRIIEDQEVELERIEIVLFSNSLTLFKSYTEI